MQSLLNYFSDLIVNMISYLCTFPLVHYLLAASEVVFEFLMDRMVLVIISFLLGGMAVLAAEYFIFLQYYKRAQVLAPPKFDSTRPQLPKILKSKLAHRDMKQTENCIWLNFLFQFLFAELRDSLILRRFLTKKIQLEFEEVLRSRSGVLVDELFLRDFNFGETFPVITGLSVDRSTVTDDSIQTLDFKVSLVYDGGFQIAIDAALPFNRMAFVSVKILKLKGNLRLQFTQLPFCHWSMSFYEEPELELDVNAQLDGRPMPKLRNIMASQIRKIVRKKHTLPMYKMRYKPFFPPRPDSGQVRDTHVQINGLDIGKGNLEVTIIEANRLPVVVKEAKVYCTASVDKLPWKEQMIKNRKNVKVITANLVKTSSDQSMGMTVKDELLRDRLNPVVTIGEVIPDFPAYVAGIQKGDILVGVTGIKVTSAKQAIKNLKWDKDRIQIQIERPEMQSSLVKDPKNNTSPRRVKSLHSGGQTDKTVDADTLSQGAPSVSTPVSSASNSPTNRSKVPHQHLVFEERRTSFVDASVNPRWEQGTGMFVFSIDSQSSCYLNVCLWSSVGDRTLKPELISCSRQDVLLGYVSLGLDEILLHCLLTVNGTMQDRVKLKHGHYKTEDELIKTWSMHKGWDPNQMYGDLTLNFHYEPENLSQQQRRTFSGCKATAAQLRKELSDRYNSSAEIQSKPSPTRIVTDDAKRISNEGHHQFESTTFMTATFCDFCGRKIWMKEAFKCQSCSMVCHKKCLVKCMVNTVCSDAGVKKRSSADEAWEPLTVTNKVKRSADDSLKIPDIKYQDQFEEIMQDGTSAVIDLSQVSLNTSESMPNLVEGVSNEGEQKGAASLHKQESAVEVNTSTRFRVVKEQTDRMKDNVLKHLRRNKTPAAFNDQAIMAAKELGAKLFIEMEPCQRREKLEEMVMKLDQELKEEMENKELLEQELNSWKQAELKNPNSRRKSEFKSLSNKVLKSMEKLDVLRLLMLQHCSGLQNCINFLEADVNTVRSRSESLERPEASRKDNNVLPKTSRSTAVGGFVKRASSSVKEKMSFMKKKGPVKIEDDEKAPISKSNNNKLNVIEEREGWTTIDGLDGEKLQNGVPSQIQVNDESSVHAAEMPEVEAVAEISAPKEVPVAFSHPVIDICVDNVDVPVKVLEETVTLEQNSSESSFPPLEEAGITRSQSDSKLEMSKMLSLRPEDILHYNSASLSQLSSRDNESSVLAADMPEVEPVAEISEQEEVPVAFSHPPIEKSVDNVDVPEEKVTLENKSSESNFPPLEEAGITRSHSDSKLETIKMLSPRPEDILHYNSASLSHLSAASEDWDFGSDCSIIESSSDTSVAGSSEESDNEGEQIKFTDGKRSHVGRDENPDGDSGGNMSNLHELQTYQV